MEKIRLTERRDFISKFDRANASICDSLGNLVCYTNGLEIYNNKHEIIANGNGINPGEFHDNYKDFGYNLNQGTIILAWPNKKGVYVLFHAIETLEDDSFYLGYDLLHTVIDMNKLNGKRFCDLKKIEFFHVTICPVGNFLQPVGTLMVEIAVYFLQNGIAIECIDFYLTLQVYITLGCRNYHISYIQYLAKQNFLLMA
ncbi:MAG: hypothetical protein IPJ43_13205 [Saprospiraceae bacterium]|nr:hypothetical protein [Saprospiraceae bacterium]